MFIVTFAYRLLSNWFKWEYQTLPVFSTDFTLYDDQVQALPKFSLTDYTLELYQ